MEIGRDWGCFLEKEIGLTNEMGLPCSNKDDKLNGDNYAHWNLIMRLWFTSKGLWDIVNGSEERPVKDSNRFTRLQEEEFLKSLVDWDALNAKAMSAIAESLTKEISPAIQTLKTAKEMWSKLAGMFDRDSTMRAVTLLGQLFSIKF